MAWSEKRQSAVGLDAAGLAFGVAGVALGARVLAGTGLRLVGGAAVVGCEALEVVRSAIALGADATVPEGELGEPSAIDMMSCPGFIAGVSASLGGADDAGVLRAAQAGRVVGETFFLGRGVAELGRAAWRLSKAGSLPKEEAGRAGVSAVGAALNVKSITSSLPKDATGSGMPADSGAKSAEPVWKTILKGAGEPRSCLEPTARQTGSGSKTPRHSHVD